MKKFIWSIVAIAIMPYSYALTLKNAAILDHDSWISGNNGKDLVILAGRLENGPLLFSSSSTARASTSDVYGIVNSNIYANGSHSYSVQNTSSSYQTYTVDLKLCANSSYCFHDVTRIGVNKGGSFSNNATSHLTCMFSYAGSYTLEATTYISGDTSSTDSSRATIYIKRK